MATVSAGITRVTTSNKFPVKTAKVNTVASPHSGAGGLLVGMGFGTVMLIDPTIPKILAVYQDPNKAWGFGTARFFKQGVVVAAYSWPGATWEWNYSLDYDWY